MRLSSFYRRVVVLGYRLNVNIVRLREVPHILQLSTYSVVLETEFNLKENFPLNLGLMICDVLSFKKATFL